MADSEKKSKEATNDIGDDASIKKSKSTAETMPSDHLGAMRYNHINNRHYSELARMSSWLFIGLLALMTFVLNAGLQHPQKYFSVSLYIAIVALPLSLLTYMIGQLLSETMSAPNLNDPVFKTSGALMVIHRLQQLFVIIGIVAITALALSTASIFFAVPTSATQAAPQATP
jgi:hypothetical protein